MGGHLPRRELERPFPSIAKQGWKVDDRKEDGRNHTVAVRTERVLHGFQDPFIDPRIPWKTRRSDRVCIPPSPFRHDQKGSCESPEECVLRATGALIPH